MEKESTKTLWNDFEASLKTSERLYKRTQKQLKKKKIHEKKAKKEMRELRKNMESNVNRRLPAALYVNTSNEGVDYDADLGRSGGDNDGDNGGDDDGDAAGAITLTFGGKSSGNVSKKNSNNINDKPFSPVAKSPAAVARPVKERPSSPATRFLAGLHFVSFLSFCSLALFCSDLMEGPFIRSFMTRNFADFSRFFVILPQCRFNYLLTSFHRTPQLSHKKSLFLFA
jgi:hypothetical protein